MVALHFFDDLCSVLRDAEEWAGYGAVFDGPETKYQYKEWREDERGKDRGERELDVPRRSNKHDKIRHIRHRQTKITLRLILPFLIQIHAVFPNYREARLIRYIKPGRADNGVNFAMLAVVPDHACFVDGVDGGEVNVYIGLLDGFHVGVAGGDAAACKRLENVPCRGKWEVWTYIRLRI